MGKILPSKLEYLSLTLSIRLNDFEVFLKNSQHTFIKKLLIYNRKGGEDILPYIKEYIMKKKRVKYLSLISAFSETSVSIDLFTLKDRVKEFKLHDIIVQRYCGLCINFDDICEFVKKID